MKPRTPFSGKLCLLSPFAACFAGGRANNSPEVTESVTNPSGTVVPGVAVTIRDLDNTERTFPNGSGVNDTGPLNVQLSLGQSTQQMVVQTEPTPTRCQTMVFDSHCRRINDPQGEVLHA